MMEENVTYILMLFVVRFFKKDEDIKIHFTAGAAESLPSIENW